MDPTSGANSSSDSDATQEGNPPTSKFSLSNLFADTESSKVSLSNLFAETDSSLGSSSWPKMTESDPGEVTPEMTEAAERVRELYASGVPFFTKHALAKLNAQLDRARKNYVHEGASESKARDGMFFLKPLDGRTITVYNEFGSVSQTDDDLEVVVVDHIIEYNTYQQLIALNKSPSQFSPKYAYCPLRIYYSALERDQTTRQFLPNHIVQPHTAEAAGTQEAFDAGVKAWEEGDECKRLTTALEGSALPNKITKVVAFACFPLSNPIDPELSITRHALILTMKNILQQKSPTADVDIRCYAQDPAYTEVDRAILERAGIHVLEDPHGFLEVDESTVVISISPYVPVRQIVADIARPAIMVWNNVGPEKEMIGGWPPELPGGSSDSVEDVEAREYDPESSRLREMIKEDYVEVHELSQHIFSASCVYVRQW